MSFLDWLESREHSVDAEILWPLPFRRVVLQQANFQIHQSTLLISNGWDLIQWSNQSI